MKKINIGEYLASYKQDRGCLMHFARLANTLLKYEESARDNHVLACNFAKYSPILICHRDPENENVQRKKTKKYIRICSEVTVTVREV